MKNYYLLALLSLLFTSYYLNGQSFQLIYSTSTYTPLVGNTVSMNNGAPWDDLEFNVPFGFSFNIAGKSYDTLQTVGSSYFLGDSSFAGIGSVLALYGADLIDRGYDNNLPNGGTNSLSPVNYQTSGQVGSRILKIQYENAGYFEELFDLGTTLDSINYQVWFYEGSNSFEVRFGTNGISNDSLIYNGETGPFMGLVTDYNITTDSLLGSIMLVEGDSTNPILTVLPNIDTMVYLNGTPINGAVFRFEPLTVGLNDFLQEGVDFSVYPNPAIESIKIEIRNRVKADRVQLINFKGQVVYNERIIASSQFIDISHLANGTYFVKIGDLVRKLVISN